MENLCKANFDGKTFLLLDVSSWEILAAHEAVLTGADLIQRVGKATSRHVACGALSKTKLTNAFAMFSRATTHERTVTVHRAFSSWEKRKHIRVSVKIDMPSSLITKYTQ